MEFEMHDPDRSAVRGKRAQNRQFRAFGVDLQKVDRRRADGRQSGAGGTDIDLAGVSVSHVVTEKRGRHARISAHIERQLRVRAAEAEREHLGARRGRIARQERKGRRVRFETKDACSRIGESEAGRRDAHIGANVDDRRNAAHAGHRRVAILGQHFARDITDTRIAGHVERERAPVRPVQREPPRLPARRAEQSRKLAVETFAEAAPAARTVEPEFVGNTHDDLSIAGHGTKGKADAGTPAAASSRTSRYAAEHRCDGSCGAGQNMAFPNHTNRPDWAIICLDDSASMQDTGVSLMVHFQIAKHDIGRGPAFLIAEIAQSHDGSLGQAHAFIDAAHRAGADAIKFQTHIAAAESTLDEPFRTKFSRQDSTRLDYWRRMEFTPEQWAGLSAHAAEKSLVFLSSAFSIEAVELLDRIGMPAWKVASGELGSDSLLQSMIATGSPFLVSSGMSGWAEIDALTQRLQSARSRLCAPAVYEQVSDPAHAGRA